MPTGPEPTSGKYYIHVKKGIRVLYPEDENRYYVSVFTWDNGRRGTVYSPDGKDSWTYDNNGPWTLERLLADPEIGKGRATDRLWALEAPRGYEWGPSYGGKTRRNRRKSKQSKQSKQSRRSRYN